MTAAQRKVLDLFLTRDVITPRYADMHIDVARALYRGDYLRATVPGGFRNGYAPLQLTMKGRETAQAARTVSA